MLRNSSLKVDTPQGRGASNVPVGSVNVPAFFKINIAVTSAATASDYALLFDTAGAVNASLGYTTSGTATVTAVGTSYVALRNLINTQPVYVEAINYRTNGTHQLLRFIQADLDGSTVVKPVDPFAAERNTQQQTDLLTLPVGFWINSMTALKVDFTGGAESIELGFFVGGQVNRTT